MVYKGLDFRIRLQSFFDFRRVNMPGFFSSFRRIHRQLKPLRKGLKVVAHAVGAAAVPLAAAVAVPVVVVAAVTVPLVMAADTMGNVSVRRGLM